MAIFLDEREDGGCALFMDGDLQFDTVDEALYHEYLVLPALTLAAARIGAPLRVLICGGGDGLALREVLRFPNVATVDLVDYSEDVVHLGRTRLAPHNADAFADPRVTVHIADAWQYLSGRPQPYDVILCDFTVPRRPADAHVYTAEWYALLRAAMAPLGVMAFNSLSPQATPEAFWCLQKTFRRTGLHGLPYRVGIPSFRDQGFGVWSFTVAGAGLTQASLRTLACPIQTRVADLANVWRNAHFSRTERAIVKRVRAHTLKRGALLPLLLNPGSMMTERLSLDQTESSEPTLANGPYDLTPLMRAIPILHPYHTRTMVEQLARQVAGTVRSIDIKRLVEALLKRASELPRALRRELRNLSTFLRERIAALDVWMTWSYRLFALLLIIITMANSISPDVAFAKGGHGGGGHGAGHGVGRGMGSFGHDATAAGHFSGTGGIRTTGAGFRGSGYGRGEMADISGRVYQSRTFRYRYYSDNRIYGSRNDIYVQASNGGGSAGSSGDTHKAMFVADTDLLVLDNGDVVVTLSGDTYLLVSGGRVSLMNSGQPTPVVFMYPDSRLIDSIIADLQVQRDVVRQEIASRRDWLSWVGWTDSFIPAIAHDETEMQNMQNLGHRLDLALAQVGSPTTTSVSVPEGAVELFVDAVVMNDSNVWLLGEDAHWMITDGHNIWRDSVAGPGKPAPPGLGKALHSIIAKRYTESLADFSGTGKDLSDLATDRGYLDRDLNQYTTIYQTNNYDPNYDVDYGTSEIGVMDAINRTDADIAQNDRDVAQTTALRAKLIGDVNRLSTLSDQFGKVQ